jgi:dTDP-4-amino-4,6-dideoxygalactose transaminase
LRVSLNRPPFGIGAVIAALFSLGSRKDLREFEAAYSAASGGLQAVWLPMARAGICWALRAAISKGARVVGPAFTCSAVHEAIIRSGGTMDLLDSAPDHFLMSENDVLQRQSGCALVLSEVYGHAYDLKGLASYAPSRPTIRIVDMAMAVPHSALFQRLKADDFAVISFNRSKSMFSGWGAIGITCNQSLAQEVRRQRDSLLLRGGFKLCVQRTAALSLSTAGHCRAVYPLVIRLYSRKVTEEPPEVFGIPIPSAWSDESTMTQNWKLPPTGVDLSLGRWNLDRADSFREVRLALARRYQENLDGADGILCPPVSSDALSYYTVRVEPAVRPRIHRQLLGFGALWPFEGYLDKSLFANAYRLSHSVLNLPLSPWMTNAHADRISAALRRCVVNGAQ